MKSIFLVENPNTIELIDHIKLCLWLYNPYQTKTTTWTTSSVSWLGSGNTIPGVIRQSLNGHDANKVCVVPLMRVLYDVNELWLRLSLKLLKIS